MLTDDQRSAATSPDSLVYVIAEPGCGKTTVAAERFGYLLYGATPTERGIRAVSFTRAATSELRQRIRRRWGAAALRWPNQIHTLDSLYLEIAHFLLRSSIVNWPGGHRTLEAVDSWQGRTGARPLAPGDHQRVLVLNGPDVKSGAVRIKTPRIAISTKGPFEAHLSAGLCTHVEIRQLVRLALRDGSFREPINTFIRSTMSALIVDELFDANPLDLFLVDLCIEQGIHVTLVGDPWQALYEFRDATPDLVPRLLDGHPFTIHTISHSFRFKSDQTLSLAKAMRSGAAIAPTPLAPPSPHVVLATRWSALWAQAPNVLPLAFGRIGNLTDAILTVVLDQVAQSRLSTRATFIGDARSFLGLPSEQDVTEGPDVARIVQRVIDDGATDPATVLREIRGLAKTINAPRTPGALGARNEKAALQAVKDLAERATCTTPSIPAMTIHQAKGCEWDLVAVVLGSTELARLGAGLNPDAETDRRIYVALTRARHHTGVLP